jgi:hypothetical protein
LTALFQEYATALVKSDPSDFDALYMRYVQQYLDAGYQQIMDERLAAYRAGNSTTLPDITAGRASFRRFDHTQVFGGRLYTIAK